MAQLLERDAELRALTEGRAAVQRDGSGRLILLAGEAGIGKTAVLRRFQAELDGDMQLLWGTCDALVTPEPLGPFFDVADALGGKLAALVSSVARPHEVATALIQELNARGRRNPPVLVLEDVHWADEATLDVIRLLGRRLDRAPALVIVSYREGELDSTHPLRLLLGELSTSSGVSRIELQPLSGDAVAHLSEPHAIDDRELYRKTGGNPFFVVEALASGEAEIPPTVRDAILARAGRLSPAARRVLEVVSVSPTDTEVWLLETLAGDGVGRLEECLASDMLVSLRDGVAFRHELARLAIESAIPPDRRVVLNRAALKALETPPGRTPDPSRLAHHAEVAGDADAVLRYAPAAAARASGLGAHREAAKHLERALRFSDGLDIDGRAALRARHAQACHVADSAGEAIAALEKAIDHAREVGSRRMEGRLLVNLAMALWPTGRIGDAHAAGTAALAVLEPLPAGEELAMAAGLISALCMDADELEAALAWGAWALELNEDGAEGLEPLVNARIYTGTAALLNGDERGFGELDDAIALANRGGLEDRVGNAYGNLASATVRVRSYAGAGDRLAAGLDYCSERGLESDRHHLLAYVARAELDLGRWAQASESATVALRERSTAVLVPIVSLVVLGLLRARQGQPGAWEALDEAARLSGPTDSLQHIAPVAAARAEVAWLEGRAADVAAETDRALELALSKRSIWATGELGVWRRAAITDELPVMEGPWGRELAGDWVGAAAAWEERGCRYDAALAPVSADEPDALRVALAKLQALEATPASQVVSRRLRELGARQVPRGPRPSTKSNSAGITSREMEVLELVALGLRNAEIAQRLFLSEKTVGHHVSSILRKLDVRSRMEAGAAAARLGLIPK